MQIKAQDWPIAGSFVIARGSKTTARVITVSITDSEVTGRGECVPYGRYNETIDSVLAQIEGVQTAIETGTSRQTLQRLLPAGAARNAIDCALWDLRGKIAGKPVEDLIHHGVGQDPEQEIEPGVPEQGEDGEDDEGLHPVLDRDARRHHRAVAEAAFGLSACACPARDWRRRSTDQRGASQGQVSGR